MQFDNWSLLLGIVLSASSLIGAILYTWTKEEVDKYYEYLYAALITVFVVGFSLLAYKINVLYLLFLAVGLTAFLLSKNKVRIYYFIGAAIGFAVQLDVKLIASLFLMSYTILLSSYRCRDLLKKDSIKFGGKCFLNALSMFLIVFVIPWPKSWMLPMFFLFLALAIPAVWYDSK